MKMCEECGERPGELNSRYINRTDEYDEGDWVCHICEEEAREVVETELQNMRTER